MEIKGKIKNIREVNGKLIGEIWYKKQDKDKHISCPSSTKLNKQWIGQEKDCLYFFENGLPIKITVDNEVIYSKNNKVTGNEAPNYSKKPSKENKWTSNNKKKSTNYSSSETNIIETGTSPYNFIPLNEKVIADDNYPDFSKFNMKQNTGYININITTKTPLYIRCSENKDEYRDRIEKQKNNRYTLNDIKSDFFSPGNYVKIPGSSLRGMVRTLIEIVSFGKFQFFNDNYLYYRALADTSDLRKQYQEKMSSFDRKTKSNSYLFHAGYIHKEGHNYYIVPAERGQYEQIEKKELRKQNIPDEEFSVHWNADGSCYVVSGNIHGKKKEWHIFAPNQNSNKIKIPNTDIENYRNDKNRSSINILEKITGNGYPIFYVSWKDSKGNNRISFGHTGYFRISYSKSISDYIFPSLFSDTYDFADSIFGTVEKHASKVSFEDAKVLQNNDIFLDESYPKVLSSPNPTSFQLYLTQKENQLKPKYDKSRKLTGFSGHLTYEDNTPIRGYKLYWHKNSNDWKESQEKVNEHPKVHTKIKPVKTGIQFKGQIKFENLTDEELGALLFVLDLPNDCAHKIGMGKPLGLGSIEIKPELYLSNINKRYSSIFEEWVEPITPIKDFTKYKTNFETYILKNLNTDVESLWGYKRIKDLKMMLSYTKLDSSQKKYMELTDPKFRQRAILPLPEDVSRNI